MGELEKPRGSKWRRLTLSVSLGCWLASTGCSTSSGLKVAGDPILGERRGPTPLTEPQPNALASRPNAVGPNPNNRPITSTADPLLATINTQPGSMPPPRTGTVPQFPKSLSANNNVEMARNLQSPGFQPLGISETNPWVLTSQARDANSGWNQGQGIPPMGSPIGPLPGSPKVIPVPLDASTSKSIGSPQQSPWSTTPTPISPESLKGALDSRGVYHKAVPVPEGIKLIAVVPSRDMSGTSQVLEVVTADYASAVQAILPRIDQLQGKR